MVEARYRLSRAARRDLGEIGRYSRRRWGADQAERYLRKLDARMDQLVDGPELGRPRDGVRAGYRSAHEGRHLIFYRVTAGRVEIVRVLHERMDWRRQLAEDTNG